MNFDDLDVFGVFTQSKVESHSDVAEDTDSFDVPVTYDGYCALVQMMAERLGVSASDAMHMFNLAPREETRGVADAELDGSSPVSGRPSPPLCAHLVREGVQYYLHHEERLPTIRCQHVSSTPTEDTQQEPVLHTCNTSHNTCITASTTTPTMHSSANGLADNACQDGPPHVHCCFCLAAAVERSGPVGPGVPPPAVEDLIGVEAHTGLPMWHTHVAQHDRRKRKFWNMLEETTVAYLGESGDEFDMENDDGRAACEAAAAEEARHGCFIVSAGTTTCPLVLFYCAYCGQLAPLLCAVPGPDGGWTLSPEDATVTWPVILAKLFMGFHMWRQSPSFPHCPDIECSEEANVRCREVTSCSSKYLFLYKPELFDTDSAVAVFEDGVVCTYAGAILPEAKVMVCDGDTKARLVLFGTSEGESKKASQCSVQSCNWGVEGFVMAWPTAAEAEAKCEMLASDKAGYQLTQCFVYVPEEERWVWAHVPHHGVLPFGTDGVVETRGWRTYDPSEDPDDAGVGAIRNLESVAVPVPRPDVATLTTKAANVSTLSERATPSEDVDDAAVEFMAAPFSMEARTMDFFGRMTLLAKAMAESSQHLRRPATDDTPQAGETKRR